jgi:hypothetical protein
MSLAVDNSLARIVLPQDARIGIQPGERSGYAPPSKWLLLDQQLGGSTPRLGF